MSEEGFVSIGNESREGRYVACELRQSVRLGVMEGTACLESAGKGGGEVEGAAGTGGRGQIH